MKSVNENPKQLLAVGGTTRKTHIFHVYDPKVTPEATRNAARESE